MSLTEQEVTMLDIERAFFALRGSKEQAVRDRLDMTATRYYQLLNLLLDREDALAHDPVTVKRLRALRDRRARTRDFRRAV